MVYIYNMNSKAKQEKRITKMDLKRNANIEPLLGEKKGWNIVVETLAFLAVMLVCMIGQESDQRRCVRYGGRICGERCACSRDRFVVS